jgi:hypothetical protein
LRTLPEAGAFDFPSGTLSLERNRKLPYMMEFSLGVQHNIGFKTVADIAYVGTLGRHLVWQRNLNAILYGTFPVAPADAARPYAGYQNIEAYQYAATSNYHSLQVAVNRRFARNLQFGVAWTWSKTMDFADAESSGVSPFDTPLWNPRVWNYGLAGFDRTHILKASFTWETPKISKYWNNAFVREVFDEWTISGIPTFQSGAPLGVSLSRVGSQSSNTISGSPTDGARLQVTHSPILPKDKRGPEPGYFFDVTAVEVPASGTPGNAGKNLFRGPGINNWDLAVFKNIPLPGERLRLQFRAEAYNAFNHTQFSSVNTSAIFKVDGKGKPFLDNASTFGQITGARANRRMQLALRLSF